MDDKNRLIVSDQYGGIYRFPVPPAGERVDPASIEQITFFTKSEDKSRIIIIPIRWRVVDKPR